MGMAERQFSFPLIALGAVFVIVVVLGFSLCIGAGLSIAGL